LQCGRRAARRADRREQAGNAQLARNLAVEWGPANVRINAISPGVVRTEFARTMLEDEALMKRRLAMTPLRRVGEPQEIAGVVLLLVISRGRIQHGTEPGRGRRDHDH
jgi:NAD(P)-dependent dehydrogenase (short-subunit alcohol dehydrogenase family)